MFSSFCMFYSNKNDNDNDNDNDNENIWHL